MRQKLRYSVILFLLIKYFTVSDIDFIYDMSYTSRIR